MDQIDRHRPGRPVYYLCQYCNNHVRPDLGCCGMSLIKNVHVSHNYTKALDAGFVPNKVAAKTAYP